jgi:tRNA nucleotidyltransferase (CCA-adding enzyme)
MQLIVTHSNTDFDALASQLAAARLYPGALPVLSEQLNENVREFAALHAEELPFVRSADLPDEPVERLILVDTAEAARLPQLGDRPVPTLIIDHHPPQGETPPYVERLHEETGANATMLVQRLIESGLVLTVVEATLLLLGIYEDTLGLTAPGTRPADASCVAWLLGQGARLDALAEFLRRPLSAPQEELLHQLVANMRLEELHGWTALFAWARTSGSVPQLSPLAHKLRDMYQPALTVLAIETGDSGCQLILRADPEAFDAGALADHFGGGGHRAAAAAFVKEGKAEAILADVEQLARTAARPAISAADLMTRRVRTTRRDASVAEAEALMARYGHSALPVVDEAGVVRGLLVRRDLDRALRHGLRDAPLARYIWQHPTVVAPDASLAEVRQALAADNGERTGRVLVAGEDKRLLGIITRSDLLRHWGGGGTSDLDGHDTMADELERFLRPDVLVLLKRAAELAAEGGSVLYVVGGTVRDMLLERPPEDLDLVVEGDAVALAEALAAEVGGTVRSHAQFGTATVEIGMQNAKFGMQNAKFEVPDTSDTGEGNFAFFILHSQPLVLDFVTARTEFYERPAALPDVEASSLRHDLHRRDFTINTLAVCLNPARYGRLYDFYGGREDLRRGLIRVLHSLSFIDDPTRILRAARLAARLGFAIEERTRELIADALEHDVLGRTTPQRIVNELRLTLREAHPEAALALMDELGVLRALHGALRWTPELAAQFEHARAANFADADLADVYLGLLVLPLTAAEREELIARFQPPAPKSRLLRGIDAIQEHAATLANPNVPNSAVDRMLHGLDTAALRAAQSAGPPQLADAIGRYLDTMRDIRLAVDGRFLRSLGLAPGPRYGELLAGLRAAVLDGEATTPEEQQAWVRARVRAETASEGEALP